MEENREINYNKSLLFFLINKNNNNKSTNNNGLQTYVEYLGIYFYSARLNSVFDKL